jgi:type II secretory pathway component PulC
VLAQGLRAIQVTLLAACAYLLYLSLSSLVGATPIPETSLPNLDPPTAAAKDFPRYQVIAERNLFQTPEIATAAVVVEEQLEESKLKLRLVGTTAGVPASLSVATVEDVGKNKIDSLRVEDMISGARVVRIERKRVVLDNRGQLEQLSLDEKARAPKRSPQNRRARAAANRRARPVSARPTRAARPRRTPP